MASWPLMTPPASTSHMSSFSSYTSSHGPLTPSIETSFGPYLSGGLTSSPITHVSSFDQRCQQNLHAFTTPIITSARCDSMMPAANDFVVAAGLEPVATNLLPSASISLSPHDWSASTQPATPLRPCLTPENQIQWSSVPVETVDPSQVFPGLPIYPSLGSSPPHAVSLHSASTDSFSIPHDLHWQGYDRTPSLYPQSSPIATIKSERAPFVKSEDVESLIPLESMRQHKRTSSAQHRRDRKVAYRRRTTCETSLHGMHHGLPTVVKELPSNVNPFIIKKKKEKHSCDLPGCESSFEKVEHLKRHKEIHTGNKPYPCVWKEQCNRSFGRQDNKRDHYKTHLNVADHGKNKRLTFNELFSLLDEREEDPDEADKTKSMLQKWRILKGIKDISEVVDVRHE